MADSLGRMVTTTSERGQWGHNKTNMAALATLGASLLEENDILGPSLCGRKPSELKNEELKFWLKCRGDPAKGLKTKAELVKRWEITLFPLPSSLASSCLRRLEVRFYSFLRVEGYIRSGRDKSIVDPDLNGLYTKRKQQRRSTPSVSSIEPSQGARLFSIHFTAICLAIFVSNLCARLDSKIVFYCLTDISPVTYPDNEWSTSLTKMPMFTKAEINEHKIWQAHSEWRPSFCSHFTAKGENISWGRLPSRNNGSQWPALYLFQS